MSHTHTSRHGQLFWKCGSTLRRREVHAVPDEGRLRVHGHSHLAIFLHLECKPSHAQEDTDLRPWRRLEIVDPGAAHHALAHRPHVRRGAVAKDAGAHVEPVVGASPVIALRITNAIVQHALQARSSF
eukprot:6932660-Prymnesium_polylepis.1